MSRYERFVQNVTIRRWAVLGSVVVILWLARSLMSTILLTFIFSFLVTRLINFVRRRVHVRPWVIVAPLYLLLLAVMMYAVIHYVPVIAKQTVNLVNSVLNFYYSDDFKHNQIMQWLLKYANQLNLKTTAENWLKTIVDYAGSITSMGVTFVLSLILSFFFTVELDTVKAFGRTFLNSPFGWYFADLKYFADKFINTFGVVIEAQIVIALVNTAITVVTLIFLKMPNIPSLGVMVFLLSMIPVAGAIISVVPLSIIAYTVGGLQDVITIIIMIIIIHVLEAYVLNPKFMSTRTQLPIFFTFVVLFVAEELFGIWGLIVGIPVFTFLLDILGVRKIPQQAEPPASKAK